FRGSGDPINRRNYDKIQVGATLANVEEFLGRSDDGLMTLTYIDLASREDRDLLLRTIPHTLRHWKNDTHMITVILDSRSQVVGKSFSHAPGVALPR
ncbi:MAG: hypothetical protein ABI453_13670, partial [Isosphaeraceae bacterium]